jgi:hypothetical protein
MLDPFVALARQHIGQPLELLNLARLEELSSIVEGASKFHRESDADGRTEGMTSRELLGLIQRTLNFIQV